MEQIEFENTSVNHNFNFLISLTDTLAENVVVPVFFLPFTHFKLQNQHFPTRYETEKRRLKTSLLLPTESAN